MGTERWLRSERRRLLQMHFEAGVGHLGGNLSCIDLVATVLREMSPEDILVLSKGHSVGAVYVGLWSLGLLQDEDLNTFHQDGTKLPGHPPLHAIPQIRFATGSLGHGFSLANGLALNAKLHQSETRIFVVMSDGEWQEGSTWEALLFAVKHQLQNLIILIDENRLQGFGTTEEVMGYSSVSELLPSRGLEVLRINGHDPDEIRTTLNLALNKPKVVCLQTTKGKGISFMENRMEWHYLPLDAETYAKALAELDDL